MYYPVNPVNPVCFFPWIENTIHVSIPYLSVSLLLSDLCVTTFHPVNPVNRADFRVHQKFMNDFQYFPRNLSR